MRPLLLTAALAMSGCLHGTHHLQVQLKDTKDVVVTDGGGRDVVVERSKNDVRVAGRTVFDEKPQFGAPRRTYTQPLGERRVDKLPGVAQRFSWKKKNLTVSTPVKNVARADVVTQWSQWHGILPSMAAVVAGGFVAVGAGVAGGASLADGRVADGVGLTLFAASGAALLGYGIVSWVLVSAGTTRSSLPIE